MLIQIFLTEAIESINNLKRSVKELVSGIRLPPFPTCGAFSQQSLQSSQAWTQVLNLGRSKEMGGRVTLDRADAYGTAQREEEIVLTTGF
ncbi:hypothetical protein J4Q44_G00121250 [Coregonus suidteri]|uniref:Uncharacterized protein n=1 Tax=Coregonus suidteri TaxID=861788 RepID=A0AAN8LQD2_9TELE